MPHYEYDKDYPFAAFITNLGKYNEGDLVGEWVKFPTTPEEMQKVFERIGIGQKDDFGQPYGNEYLYVDEDMRLRLETKLIHSIVTGFKVLPV